MRGYGRDYDDRNWFERAEDTVRGWFGSGPSYDRDYPATHPRGEWGPGYNAGGRWERGPDRGGYLGNNWNNQHASWESVDRAARGYYGADYRDRPAHFGGSSDYDRDFGRDWSRGSRGGMGRGMSGGYGGGLGGGTSGGMRGSGRWMGPEYGAGRGDYTGGGWGDYSGGGYGGDRWRNSTSGGVQPGRYFRGYGNGSTSGSGYEPY
jgi:hypothetical protein